MTTPSTDCNNPDRPAPGGSSSGPSNTQPGLPVVQPLTALSDTVAGNPGSVNSSSQRSELEREVREVVVEIIGGLERFGSGVSDCICDKLGKIADGLEKVFSPVMTAIAGKVGSAQDGLQRIGTYVREDIAGTIGATEQRLERITSGYPIPTSVGASGYIPGDDYPSAVLPGNGSGSAVVQSELAVQSEPQPALIPALQLLDSANDKPQPTPTPTPKPFPTLPEGCPELRSDKWNLWTNDELCISLVTAPNEAPLTGGYYHTRSYDTQREASDAQRAYDSGASSCAKQSGKPEIAETVNRFQDDGECEKLNSTLASVGLQSNVSLNYLMGLTDADGKDIDPPGADKFAPLGIPLGGVVAMIARLFLNGVDLLLSVVVGSQKGETKAAVGNYLKALPASFLERWVGIGIPQLTVPHQYAGNFLSPVELPSAAETRELYQFGAITREQADCWGRANGRMSKPFSKQLDASESVYTPQDAFQLHRRGMLTDEQLQREIRKNGWAGKHDKDNLSALTQFIPPPSDIVRFVARDVGDQAVVDQFGLDVDFDKKWQGDIVKYAQWLNVPKEVARLYWRVHWRTMSPEQMFVLYHRFRHLDINDPRYVGIGMVEDALKWADYPPKMIAPLIAASFKTLTRVDTIRAMELGTLTTKQLADSYRDLGYSDDNIAIMVKYTNKLVANRIANSTAVKAFIRGELNWQQAISASGSLSDGTEIEKMVRTIAEDRRIAKRNGNCTRGIRNRFLRGEFDEIQATNKLVDFGIDKDIAASTVKGWNCEMRSRDLKPTIATLSRWFVDGTITGDDYIDRLVRLGYKRFDALRMHDTVLTDGQLRNKKAEDALAKQQAVAAKRNQQAAKGKAKDEQAEMKRKRAEQKAEMKAKAAVLKKLEQAIIVYKDKMGLSIEAAGEVVKTAYRSVLSVVGLENDATAVEAIYLAAKEYENGGLELWELASSLVQSAKNVQT